MPSRAAFPPHALMDRGGLLFLEPKDDLEPCRRQQQRAVSRGPLLANTCVLPSTALLWSFSWGTGPHAGAWPRRTPTTPTSLRAAARSRRGCSPVTPPYKGVLVPIVLPAGGAIGGGRSHLRVSLPPIRQRTCQPYGDPRSGAVARLPSMAHVQRAFHQ